MRKIIIVRIPCQLHLLIVLLLSLCTAAPLLAAPAAQPRKSAVSQITAAYENTTITEDVSWSGTVVIKGALVVAPQATLRIEPGAEIRFSAAKGSRQLPRLVVMGRIMAVGSLDRPILFSAVSVRPAKRGDWGGILLLSSEKRNQLEHCRIEGADTALEGRFSSFSAKSLFISASTTGIAVFDSTATLKASSVSGCETGVDAHDSEIELRDTSVAQNRRGLTLYRTSTVMSSVTVTGNSLLGMLAEECRIKMTSCEISANKVGAQIKGGEGQLFMSRFTRNNETALHLTLARLKVSRCQFSDNLRDGLRLEDSRSSVWGNSFSGNGNYNLVNAGTETISAVQNWWGAADEPAITAKLLDATRDGRYGRVQIFPWLQEKPTILP
jgi:hypothetical protein